MKGYIDEKTSWHVLFNRLRPSATRAWLQSAAKAHITGDTTFLNNIFTQDAKAFPPNSDIVTGRPAIAAVNSQWVNFDIKQFREVTTAFYGNEDYLIDEGNYFISYGKDNTIDKGKYLNVWKKENGDWKIFSNIWNTSMPANPAK